ncbi:MAG: hypothetical protein IPK03_16355, partial [Bacteroidetes bacterium]|nr:hypothetical protein [Bacteroidota bacterium]
MAFVYINSSSQALKVGATEEEERGVSSVTFSNLGAPSSYANAVFYSYDIQGNVKTLINENTDINDPFGFKRLNYKYDLISGKVNQVTYQPGKAEQFVYKYQYDADNRLVKASSSVDLINWNKDAQYYYYAHGPLARVEIGNDQQQGVDYAYTIQGWLKSINGVEDNTSATAFNYLSQNTAFTDMGRDGVSMSAKSTFGIDAYGLNLHYFSNDVSTDYYPIGLANITSTYRNASIAGTPLSNSIGDLYNGNI